MASDPRPRNGNGSAPNLGAHRLGFAKFFKMRLKKDVRRFACPPDIFSEA